MRGYKIIFILILSVLEYTYCYSQEIFPEDSIKNGNFELSCDLGVGGSYYSTKPNVPIHLETKVSKFNEAFTFRLNWKTDHRLTLSIESGRIKFYSYSLSGASSEGNLKITAVPLLIEFGMPLTKKFQVRAGAGSYFQTSELNYLGKVRSNSVSLGWIAGGTYSVIAKKNNSLGLEFKWMDAAESEQAIVVLQLVYRYSFLKW